jgi:glycosyltransferase involved in cell wall biosynthesis
MRLRDNVPRLSAIVITKNEAGNIADCLDGLAFCDERIVVDSGSDDGTVDIAGRKGARVVTREWGGFGPQKNFALSLASGDWVLSIDADERVSAALAREIAAAIAVDKADGYEIPRTSSFLGRDATRRLVPVYVLRLFRRNRAHSPISCERVVCDGALARLREPLQHHTVIRPEDAVSRDRYSSAGAAMLIASGRRVSFASGISHGLGRSSRLSCAAASRRPRRLLLAVANAKAATIAT